MSSPVPLRHYTAPNHAHKVFIERFRFLNALYYPVVSSKNVLRQELVDATQIPESVVGVVTHAVDTRQFQGVFVPSNDATAMANDFESFLDVLQKQTIVTAYRYFADFCMDLLADIVKINGSTLPQKLQTRLEERFMNLEHIKLAFQDHPGVAVCSSDDEQASLNCLLATRNGIEHADCRVDREYLRLTGTNLHIGDVIPAGSKEAGEALAIVEHLVQALNERCLSKWSLAPSS